MVVKVIDERCIQCGLCAELAPEVFELPEDSTARVKSQPKANDEESAKEAAQSCPTEAIEVS